MTVPTLDNATVKRLVKRWGRYATMERKLCDETTSLDSKARAYGAWLAYRMCRKELKRMMEEGR